MSLLDDVSIVVTPNGYKAGTLFSAIPSSGAADLEAVRNTAATRVDEDGLIEVVADNVPRIDYSGGGCPHILAEPQRKNDITYSEDFTEWSSSSSPTLTENATTSPDGTTNATELLSTSSGSRIQINLGVQDAADYTQSVFVKYKDVEARLNFKNNQFGGDNKFIIASSGVTLDSSSNDTNIEDFGNGWFKISVTYTANGTNASFLQIFGDLSVPYASYYLWGAQLEEGSYATSYIPTDGGTVTRNQDQFSRDGISSLINSEEGVLFVEAAALADTIADRYIVSLSNGSNTNMVYIRFANASNRIEARSTLLGSNVGLTSTSVTDETEFHKIAYKWKLNDYALWVDGFEVATATGSVSSANTFNTLNLADGNGNSILEGKVKQLQVFKTALGGSPYDSVLSDARLAALTS